MHASAVSKMEVEPILCSVPQGCQMLGIGTQAMYDLMGVGLVKAVKHGTRTLLVVESLRAYAELAARGRRRPAETTQATPPTRSRGHHRHLKTRRPQRPSRRGRMLIAAER